MVTHLVAAAESAPAKPAVPAVTDPADIWSMPTSEKTIAHPLHIEGRVSYYDRGFKLFWIERNDAGVYILLSDAPPALQTGQYVTIDGTIIPSQGLRADSVTVHVLQENAPITPLASKGRINDLTALNSRIVTTEGYVDSQLMVDADHIRLILIVENRPVICWIKPDDPAHVPDWRGRLIRVTGLYSSRFDPTQTSTSIEFWLGRQSYLQILGTLSDNAEFRRPTTPINELFRTSPGTAIHIRGTIETHQVGKSMTVRDATGQVEVRSIQQERLPAGSEVDAVGKVAFSNAQVVVDTALYRPTKALPRSATTPDATPASNAPLKTVAQIRALGADEAAQRRPVQINGMVTWSLPESDFFFLEDLTGGVRVYYDRAKTGSISFGKYFSLTGVTRAGRITPAVDLRDFTDLGSMSHPPAKPITLDQAMTGREDGEWVELRGFVHDIVSQGDWRWIHVTTPSGDFTGHLQNPVNFVANPGSLIRIHGVCETNLDADGHISGITLRVPFLHDITIEEDAPADYYDLPRHSLADLERLSAGQTMMRVRVTGTVVHAVPGQNVYLQEGNKGMLLLTHETESLAPGDQLEAVGILGRDGARTVLRETVYRRTSGGATPEPFVLTNTQHLAPNADNRLVRLRGTLIDVLRRPAQLRLTLQQDNTLFEATLDHPPADAAEIDLPVGAGLEVMGIYRLVFDDSRQPHGFQLLLRTPGDVQIYSPAKLWTVQRALAVAAILAGCMLLGIAWIRSLRQQVQRQTRQIRAQMEQQARLEAEVQRATRLASLGGLAGGIAHDYNNLLTIIMGNLSFMKFNPLVMNTESERIRDIEQGAIRARDLTRQLLTFAEGGDPLRTATDIFATVRGAAERVVGGTNVRCVFEIAPDLKRAHVDQEQIAQVVQNLVRNAVQAMPGGGTIRIVLSNVEVTGSSFAPPHGSYVKLTVTDAGEGIPADALPRIFDPFFSTRNSNGGLGLATAYSIVKKHGGHIEAHSTVGHGATFTIWLPVATAMEKPLSVLEAEIKPANRKPDAPPARVLLMDDEDSIRRLGSMLLQRMGLEPTTVADGASALKELECAQNAGRPFSLLILDLTIPGGMGGKDTIEAIRKTGVQVPAIVCSGYSRDPVLADFIAYGFQAVVTKPYQISYLTETIQRFLPQAGKS
jgi:signal transduction histidine kinase/ActR/RegA family two-component response regulator